MKSNNLLCSDVRKNRFSKKDSLSKSCTQTKEVRRDKDTALDLPKLLSSSFIVADSPPIVEKWFAILVKRD